MSKPKSTHDDDDPLKRMNNAYYTPTGVPHASPAAHGGSSAGAAAAAAAAAAQGGATGAAGGTVPGMSNATQSTAMPTGSVASVSNPTVVHQYDERPYMYPQYGYAPYEHPDMTSVPQAPTSGAPYAYKPGQFGYYPPPPDGYQFQEQWDQLQPAALPPHPLMHMHGGQHLAQAASASSQLHTTGGAGGAGGGTNMQYGGAGAQAPAVLMQSQMAHLAQLTGGSSSSSAQQQSQVPRAPQATLQQQQQQQHQQQQHQHAPGAPSTHADYTSTMGLGVRQHLYAKAESPQVRHGHMKRASGAGIGGGTGSNNSGSTGGVGGSGSSSGTGGASGGPTAMHTGGRLSRRASEVLPTMAPVTAGSAELLLLATLLPGEHKTVAKRSRMGCLTCRLRKKRCCETRPRCTECTRLRLNCVWPAPGTEHKNKPKDAKEEENTINHEIYGKIKVLRGIVEYRSS